MRRVKVARRECQQHGAQRQVSIAGDCEADLNVGRWLCRKRDVECVGATFRDRQGVRIDNHSQIIIVVFIDDDLPIDNARGCQRDGGGAIDNVCILSRVHGYLLRCIEVGRREREHQRSQCQIAVASDGDRDFDVCNRFERQRHVKRVGAAFVYRQCCGRQNEALNVIVVDVQGVRAIAEAARTGGDRGCLIAIHDRVVHTRDCKVRRSLPGWDGDTDGHGGFGGVIAGERHHQVRRDVTVGAGHGCRCSAPIF